MVKTAIFVPIVLLRTELLLVIISNSFKNTHL
ncbi:hypothetical protein M124_1268, partial [Bacteroides fragilis str. 3988T(B)14]